MLVAVGHSHARALIEGAQRKHADVTWITKPSTLPNGDLSPSTRRAIEDGFSQPGAESVLLAFIGGNSHNVIGLIQHPQPFDFILPERPDLPITPGAEIIPFQIVRHILLRRVAPHYLILRAIKTLGIRVVQFESPPPIPDNSYIAMNSFRKNHDAITVDLISPKWLRYKLWRTHSRLYKRQCKRLDIKYVQHPKNTVDADGFLQAMYWGNATHANAHYGLRLLAQIDKIRRGRP